MNLPPLPELPEPDMCHQKARDDYDEEYSHSPDQLRAYALSYGRAVQQAESELWDLMRERAVTVAPAYIRDASGRFNGWMTCDRGGEVYRGDTPLEAMLAYAAAIRNGVIREGEGE